MMSKEEAANMKRNMGPRNQSLAVRDYGANTNRLSIHVNEDGGLDLNLYHYAATRDSESIFLALTLLPEG